MEKDLSYHNLQYASKLNENNVSISFVPTNSFFQGFTQVFLLVKPECNQMFVVKNVTPPDANHTAFSLLRHEKDDPSSGLKFTPVFQTRDFDFSTAKLEPVHQNTPIFGHVSTYLLASLRPKNLPVKPTTVSDYIHTGYYFNHKNNKVSSEKWGTEEFIDDCLIQYFHGFNLTDYMKLSFNCINDRHHFTTKLEDGMRFNPPYNLEPNKNCLMTLDQFVTDLQINSVPKADNVLKSYVAVLPIKQSDNIEIKKK